MKGPSYYFDLTCARTTGSSYEAQSRPIYVVDSDDEDKYMDVDSGDGGSTEVCVLQDEVLGEGEHAKRKRERLQTHGKYLPSGIRQKREKIGRKRMLVNRVKESLSSKAPKGAKWSKVLAKEEKLKEKLQQAPSEDIAAQIKD